jgi:WD40 repeat protein/DNA-binding SARP family transcriptional activator/energy-coupling factor transporter ATP-binding protein EcfA2
MTAVAPFIRPAGIAAVTNWYQLGIGPIDGPRVCAHSPAVTVAVLGPVAIDGDDRALSPRDRIVLSALVARGGEAVTADVLADALWGERPPASAAKVVQGCVARLRRALGASAIETSPHGYRLALPGDHVDVCRFERLVGRARQLLTLGENERAAYTASEALALWRGRALADLDGWDAGRVEAGRLDGLRLDAEELRLEAALRAGRHREVLVDAQAAVAAAPLREQRWGLLATAQYQCGQQAEALRSLQRVRALLADELGLDPSPELVGLERAILRQDPALAGAPALSEADTTCPYRGLRPYDVSDADGFFGRDDDLAACLARLAATGTLVVVGASGSGKSSLVRAGVGAALRRAGENVVVVTPGAHPLEVLSALSQQGRCVLIVDQLEEVSTVCTDPDERARFFAALAEQTGRQALVLALRADRMGDLAAYPDFAHTTEPGLYLLGPLTEPQLREAIERPARQAGLLLEPGLADLLVEEVLGERGALPLLSHALRRTWERREGRALTIDGYRAAGGIRGAVAQSAEQVYAEVADDQRQLLRDVLLRLVTPTGGEPAATQVPRRMLAADPAREAMIERLVAARLVTADGDTVQVAHEALFRAWPRLRDWLDDDVAGQRVLRHLSAAADTWESMARPDSELYRGARLVQARSWRETAHASLTTTEADFLEASARLADTERAAVVEQARQQKRVNRRLRGLLAGVAALLVVALLAGLLAARQANRAGDEARVATARELASDANATLASDPELSILLAMQAVRTTRSADGTALPQAVEALHRAVISSRVVLTVPHVGGALAWSPDGATFVTEGRDNSGLVDLRDAFTGRRIRAFHGHNDINDVAYSPNGAMLATAGDDGYLRVWDVRTGTLRASLKGPTDTVWGPAFSPDGSLVSASWVEAGVVELLNVQTDRRVRTIRPGLAVPATTAFSPDGNRLAVSAFNATSAVVVDTRNGHRVYSLSGHGQPIVDADWSPNGRWLATAGIDDTVRVWDARTGRLRFTLADHTGPVNAVDWSADSTRLVSGSTDKTAKVWQISTDSATLLTTLSGRGTRHGAQGVALSPDGQRVMAGDLDTNAVTVWALDLAGDAELAHVPATPGGYNFNSVGFTADGADIAVSHRRDVTLWDARTGASKGLLRPLSADGPQIETVRIARDGTVAAASSFGKTVSVWEPGRLARTISFDANVWAIDWTPDGRLLAAGLEDGNVSVVDRSGRQRALLRYGDNFLTVSVRFSPDGKRLAAGTSPTGNSGLEKNRGVTIWDWRRQTVVRRLDAGGKTIASTTADDTWPPATSSAMPSCGTSPVDGDCVRSPDPPASSASRSATTARRSPPVAPTARSGSGMPTQHDSSCS